MGVVGVVAWLKNSSSAQGNCISHIHCCWSSGPLFDPLLFCSMTLLILAPAGNFAPRIVTVSLTLPILCFQILASVSESRVMKIGCCRSLTASGLVCRFDCVPTVALSTAVFALCLEVCFRRAGGRLVLTLVSAAIAFAISWHTSVGYSH